MPQLQVAREKLKSAIAGVIASGILAALIVLGSRNLEHFDAALVGYTFATLFATFGITYRYAMWLQRPPTRMYWRRGWQAFFSPRLVWPQPRSSLARRFVRRFAANRFIFRRGRLRWARALADHVGLPPRGGDHLPAGLGLDSLRDRPGRPAHVPHVRLRLCRAGLSRRVRCSRSSSSTGWSGRRSWSSPA